MLRTPELLRAYSVDLNVKKTDRGLLLPVKVVPGASRSRVVGFMGGALKVAVTAAAEKGKANSAVIELLADQLGLPRQCISVHRGHSAPHKVLLLEVADVDAVLRSLKLADSR